MLLFLVKLADGVIGIARHADPLKASDELRSFVAKFSCHDLCTFPAIFLARKVDTAIFSALEGLLVDWMVTCWVIQEEKMELFFSSLQ